MKSALIAISFGISLITALASETAVDKTASGDWSVSVASGTNLVTAVQSGAGRIVKTGSGVLALARANTFAGGVEVREGVVAAAVEGALGSGPAAVSTRAAAFHFTASATAADGFAVFANDITFTGSEDVGYSGNYSDDNNNVVFFRDTRLAGNVVGTRSFRLRHQPRNTGSPKNGGPSTIFDGSLNAGDKTIFLNLYGTMTANGAVTAGVLSGGEAWSGGGQLVLNNSANRLGRLILCNNTVVCGAEDVLGGAEVEWRLTGGPSAGLSLIDLNGRSQTISGISHHYFGGSAWDDSRYTSGNFYCFKSTNPATLVLTGGEADCTAYATLRGAVSLILDASSYPGFTQTFAANASTFTGTTTIRAGTLRLAEGASFSGTTSLTIGPRGRFDASSLAASPFAQRISLALADGARLALPASVPVEVGSLTIAGAPVAPGVYFPENLPTLESGLVFVYDAQGKLPVTGDFTAPATIVQPTGVVGDHIWKIPADSSLVFDDALKCLIGTVRLQSPKKADSVDLHRGRLVFKGTNTIDGAIVSTATVVQVSGLLATPGHVDQGLPERGGAKTISITGQNGLGYLTVSNAVIEKPVFLAYVGYGALRSAAGTTNVFRGRLTWPNQWLGFTAADNSELVFEGGFEAGWTMRHNGGGTIRIRETPIVATNSIGWNVGTGTLALDVPGNRFKHLSAGHLNGNASVIRFGCSHALDPRVNRSLLCALYWSDSPSQFLNFTGGRADIYLEDTVQEVHTLAGSGYGTIHGRDGARIEIFGQGTDNYLKATELAFASKLDGDVSLVMRGTGTFQLKGRTFETDGALRVSSGTVEIASGAVWKGKGGVAVTGTGRLKVNDAGALDSSVVDLRLDASGTLEIPSGVALSVRTLDAETDGVWYRYTSPVDFTGASGALAGRIVGGGTLRIVGADEAYAGEMPLEWNTTYDTAVPYEVEIDTAKLGALANVAPAAGFAVFATVAGVRRELAVTCLEGRRPERVALRFTVPAGTTTLACRAGVGMRRMAAADTDNLFAGALEPAASWTLGTGFVRTDRPGGILFYNPIFASGRYATYSVAVPEKWRGKPVRLEVDCANESKMVWGGHIRIYQYDAAGNRLPEAAVDPRWTSHMRPVGRTIEYRENGRIHPDAARVEARFEVRSVNSSWDNYGLALKDPEDVKARLFISRLVLRPAAELPFPKYDDAFFAPGVSTAPGDAALKLGGENGVGFFYATRSQAAWSEGTQMRQEAQIFFPAADGTVEAFFKPRAWPEKEVYLFTGFHINVPDAARNNRKELFALKYRASSETLALSMKDLSNKVFTCSCACPLAVDQWTHLAVSWTVGGVARVFVNGSPLATTALTKFVPLDLAAENHPNDEHVVEFFLGSHHYNARDLTTASNPDYPLFEGEVDNLRVSTGARYTAAFTPSETFSGDDATRALFTFDRSFDGTSGGGIRFIRGSVRALVDRVQHRLAFGGKELDYYPAEILDEVHPKKVLDLDNYPNLPSVDDFRMARAEMRSRFELAPGDRAVLTAPKGVVTDYIEVMNTGLTPLVHPTLVNDLDVDPRSFGDIAETMHIENYPYRERANRIFQYVIGASDYFMNHSASFVPGTDSPEDVEYQALTMLNAYCGFECGPLNNMAVNLFACSGRCPASQTGGYGHSFEQVFYDGKNHIYDLSAQTFLTAFDNETAAYLEEASDQPGLFHRLGYSPEHSIRKSTRVPEAGNPAYREKAAMTLRPRERFRVWFDNNGEVNDLQCSKNTGSPRENYNAATHAVPGSQGNVWRVNRFFPQYGSGFLVYEGRVDAANPAFSEVTPTSFVYSVRSAFPIVAASYMVKDAAGVPAATEISVDRGASWRPLPTGWLRYDVRARTEYLVRVHAPSTARTRFTAITEVQVNARIFPGRLREGQNGYVFKADGGERVVVTVGYRRPTKVIDIVGGVYAGTIPGAERQLVALDPGQVLNLPVTGLSEKAYVRAHGGLAAQLVGGRLQIAVGTAEKGFAAVDVVDGASVKELTVLVSPHVRLAAAGDALVPGGSATLATANATRVQPCINFTDKSATAAATFAEVPAGKYAVLTLTRCPSHDANRLAERLKLAVPGVSGKLACGYTVNDSCNYYKAHYGRRDVDTRGNFKWDYPYQPGTSYYTHMMNIYTVPQPFSALDFSFAEDLPAGVELAAVLVVPVDKTTEEDFYCDIMKILGGLNTRPWKVGTGKPPRGSTCMLR